MTRPRSGGDAPPTPTTIWTEIADGRSWAVHIFCKLYGPFIFTLAKRRGLSHADADDVVSEVLSNMLDQIQKKGLKVDHARGLFRSYLATSVIREARRVGKKAVSRREQPLVDGAEAAGAAPPDEELEAIERHERFHLILELLRTRGPGGRLPVNWSRKFAAFYDYTVREIKAKAAADRYGISTEELYRIKYEMLEHIRRMWADLDRDLGEV